MSERGAESIVRGFDAYQERFRTITRRARQGFEQRAWATIRRDTVERLEMYGAYVDDALNVLRIQLGDALDRRELWAELKRAFARAILGRDDFELAQSFYNSLARRVFRHVGVDPTVDFVESDFPLPYRGWEMAAARTYACRRVDAALVRKILADADFNVPFRDVEGDARRAALRLARGVEERFGTGEIDAVDVLRPVLVRNKGAYVVGRVRRGDELLPVVLALLNPEEGLVVDAVVHTEDETSIILSFARWYFHVDVPSPRPVIGFLHSLLPRKRLAELYIALGFHKHGKTELYTDLMRTIRDSEERFVRAPGAPGLVMSVFTLPDYGFVFKVIKDHFPPSKSTSRREVMEKYELVLLHDRVGRLVDFQEFEHLTFPRERFAPELLDELLEVAGDTVELHGDEVVVRHLYIGRQVVPLDVFLADAEPGDPEAEAAVIDWGAAIKDLARANIFAGDMLLKNFGVTRHGRVVFYDYDELVPLTDCNFRPYPEPRDEIEALAAEPWFSVGRHDVFPEEMRTFLGPGGWAREAFLRHHADLFELDFWRAMRSRNESGEVIDFFPYAEARRLQPDGRSVR